MDSSQTVLLFSQLSSGREVDSVCFQGMLKPQTSFFPGPSKPSLSHRAGRERPQHVKRDHHSEATTAARARILTPAQPQQHPKAAAPPTPSHLRAAAAALHSDTTSPAPHSPNPGFFFRVSRRRPGARREATPDGPILSVQDAPPPQTKALSGDRGPGGGSAPRPDLSCNPDLSGNRCRSWRRSARTENPVRSTPVPRPAHRRQERQSVLREHRAWPERASWDPKYL